MEEEILSRYAVPCKIGTRKEKRKAVAYVFARDTVLKSGYEFIISYGDKYWNELEKNSALGLLENASIGTTLYGFYMINDYERVGVYRGYVV